MTVTIYGDVLFFVNACMDYIILWTTAFLLRKSVLKRRILAGSCFLSLVCCTLIFLPWFHGIRQSLAGFLLLGGVAWWIFKPHSIKMLLKLVLFTYLSSFVLGGLATSIYYHSNIGILFTDGSRWERYPLLLLVVSTVAFYFGLRLLSPWLESHLICKRQYCSVRVRWKENEIPLQLLIDTGNSLEKTKDGEDILIVSFPAIQHFFSKEVRQYFFLEGYRDERKFQEKLLSIFEKPIILPFSSLGNADGSLVAFKADCVIFENKNLEVEQKNIYIGVYSGSFQGGYDGLLSPSVIPFAE